jgi:F-type H+-transporting ATPase subunit epsilon
MATPFTLELVTPERVLFSGEVEEVSLRTEEGEIAFLAHHEDFVGAVDISVCTITLAEEEGNRREAAVHGGFVHVADNTVTILASVAELAEEIDVERARQALGRAEQEAATAPERTESPEEGAVAHSSTMIALLEPELPEVAARRARIRLEAAGASPAA